MKRIIPILLTLLLALSGCMGNNTPSPTNPGEMKGSLSLTIKSVLSAKTIEPDLDMSISRYQIYGTGPNGKTFNQSVSESQTTVAIDLVVGQWSINVDAYNNSDIKIAEGTATVTITPGNNNLALTIRPLTGEGTLKLDLAWTEGALSNPLVKSSLTSKNGVKDLTFTIADTKAAASYTGTEKAGYHILIVKLLQDNILKWGMMEAVRIITDQTSYQRYDIEIIEGNVTMTISPDLQNPILVSFNTEEVTLKYGEDVTINATTSQPVDSYQWYLDGDPLTGQTSSTINIGNALALGKHRLDLLVMKGDIYSSGSVGINVTRTGATPTPTPMRVNTATPTNSPTPTNTPTLPPTPTPITTRANVAAGYYHSLALKENGTVWAWGYNNYGQLGNGGTTNRNTPGQVSTLSNVIAVAGGYCHSLALKSDGTVWAWGYNIEGELGNGTNNPSYTPIQVISLSNIIAIAAGGYHNLALKNDGTVWAWGYNGGGQLGNLSTTNCHTPVQVNSLSNVVAIAAGANHSMALFNDGTISAWGSNNYGQLGIGSKSNSAAPVHIIGISNIKAIGAGFEHSMALKADNTLLIWGNNVNGQLGNGTAISSIIPIALNGLSNIRAFAGGNSHSLAILYDGTVWAWGWNLYGQLGIEPNTNRYIPTQVSSISNIFRVSAGLNHSIAVKSDGTVWAWGLNDNGQVGDGTTSNKYTPVQLSGFSLF